MEVIVLPDAAAAGRVLQLHPRATVLLDPASAALLEHREHREHHEHTWDARPAWQTW